MVLQSGPVLEFELRRGAVDRDRGGNVVEGRSEPPVARLQQILGALLILDVSSQVVPPGDRAVLRVHRDGPTMEPAIHAVRATEPVVRPERLPAFDGMRPPLEHHRAIELVDEGRPIL